MKDMIRQPNHYMANGEETIVKIVKIRGILCAIEFCEGNIIKYQDRAEFKGNKEQDLQKAKEYERMSEDLKKIRTHIYKVQEDQPWMCTYRETARLVQLWSENGHSLEGIL